MKSINIIKALKKKGWEIKEEKWAEHCLRISCDNGVNKCHWYLQDHENGETDSVYVMKSYQFDDYHSDDFPGTFWDTIKTIIRSMERGLIA
jgi:hypothetical protein